jgi:hypothetical protein
MKDDWLDISDYSILPHCRRRWKKRWLDFTPHGEKRIKTIEEAIMPPMRIIREYAERGTLRVTDFKYEFVVDESRKIVISLNAAKKEVTSHKLLKKKKRGSKNETISRSMQAHFEEWE